ncbi:hypothetical protein Tsubulata_040250 [Turnera subulata]|uniref:Cyclic nucleotide-binding domain-containing protein n=1 Tax=Turnera subulata TaxID=218843 RepID=A0A9Q0FVX0_9ROSI|nr:hypothetical protein Tsubulata_040250 [Turnera subulata]
MAGYDKDDVPMLREGNVSSRFQAFVSRNRSASFSVRMNSSDDYDTEANLVGYTGPLRSKRKDPLIQMSGPLHINRKPLSLHNVLYGDAKGWAKRLKNRIDQYIPEDNRCIAFDWSMAKVNVVLRSITDIMLAYVARESRVVGTGELVVDPKKIAWHYLRGFLFVDLFNVLPLPQRVGQCLRDTCHNSNIMDNCKRLIDCEYESTFRNSPPRELWKQNEDVIACFQKDGPFDYGVYGKAVNLTTKHITQIGTLAGNQEPSYFVWEIVFTMLIVAQGLLVFAFLIGNMQNFLQALGRRRLEMSLRQRDVEQWMSWRRFPLELRRKVREAERYNWAATRGVDEKRLMEDLSEDLQREIRRHLFEFVKKHVLDSICGRLRPNIYLKESEILSQGCPVEKMVFIVRGKLESIGQDRNVVPLGEGNVCGEELLIWCLENSATSKVGKKINAREQQLICSRTVRCLTNVEAFSLKAADLEEITSTFTRSLRNPRKMAGYEKDEVPMLSDTHPQLLDEHVDSRFQAFASRNRSASISIPMNSLESYETETNLVGYTGPLRSERKAPLVQMSGPLYINSKAGSLYQPNNGVTGWKTEEAKAEKYPSFGGIDNNRTRNDKYSANNEHLLRSGQLGMCNDPYCTTCPTYYHFKASPQKNSLSSSIFDPKFHNGLYDDAKGWARRLKKVVDPYIPGVMNPHAKDVQRWNKFFVISCLVAIFVDPLFFFLLSVRQDNKCIVIDWTMTKAIVVFRSLTDAVYLLNILLQQLEQILPKTFSEQQFLYSTFPDCLGSCLFSLRVNQCLRDACRSTGTTECMQFIDCGQGVNASDLGSSALRTSWKQNENATACFDENGSFPYGIYVNAVNLTSKDVVTRYVYSLFWGFQNFLQALGRRRLEMSLRRRDVEQWMSHRRLPQELRRKVLEAERYYWAATRGVWIFNLMDEHVLDSICERLKQNIYIKGSEILYHGGLVDKMTFIVRGKMESIGADGTVVPLTEGNVCGEELLTWCLEHSSVSKDAKKIKFPGQRLVSSRTVRCLTNVEAFSLRAADLEEVTSIFARSLRNPRVQGAIRYESPYWRAIAATRIQVAWRYRQKRLKRTETSQRNNSI